MSTKHLGIRDAVKSAYTGSAAVTALVASTYITGNRDDELASDVAADIRVLRTRSEANDPSLLHASAPIDWLTQVRTLIRARSEANADAIAAACYAALMADPSLGGRAAYLVPEAFEWDEDQAEKAVCTVAFDIRVVHRTDSNIVT